MPFFKKYWGTLSALGSIVILTASFLFWMDARFESREHHSREVCELRNELLVLSNGLAKIVLMDSSRVITEQLYEYENIPTLTANQAVNKATLVSDLFRYQTLLVKIESANLEELKNVCM